MTSNRFDPRRISAFLPPSYVQRLMLAAAMRDDGEIDEITDELAKQHPELVRPRGDVGRFVPRHCRSWPPLPAFGLEKS